jgi:hypothetical protein
MAFPTSQLVAVVQPLLNCTVATAAASVTTPNINPGYNATLVLGVNSGNSGSLAVPVQGVNGNPSCDYGTVIPQSLCNLQNEILIQAASTYRI